MTADVELYGSLPDTASLIRISDAYRHCYCGVEYQVWFGESDNQPGFVQFLPTDAWPVLRVIEQDFLIGSPKLMYVVLVEAEDGEKEVCVYAGHARLVDGSGAGRYRSGSPRTD